MKNPFVSVLILNYNGLKYLRNNLDSLRKQTYKNFEIIFVDNNSEDDSVKFVKNNYPEVKVIQLKENYGFAKGNNLGMPHANGEYIILLNQDTVVDPNWLSESVKTANSSPNIGIVGGKFYHFGKNKILGFGGSLIDKYGNAVQFGSREIDKGYYDRQTKAFFITGAGILFKRELYEKIGLFDESYFMYYEDVDFCWRALLIGYDVIYNPKAIIYHVVNDDVRRTKQLRNIFFIEKNRIRTLLKNYQFKTLISLFPLYILSKLRFVFNLYLNDKIKAYHYVIKFLKAIIWNLKNFKSLLSQRKYIQSIRTKNDSIIFELMKELRQLKVKIDRCAI